MDTQSERGDAARSGVATWIVDVAVACVLLGLGTAVLIASSSIGAGWTSNGPGAGYFPFYIGLILVVSSLGIIYQAVFGKKRNTAVFADGEQFRRVLSVLVPALFFVLAIQVLGIYIASLIYIALFMAVLGKYSWVRSVTAAFIVTALLFLMFEVWFKVPLFKGKLDLLGFLGY